MNKKHFEDLEMSATIVEFFYIILKIFSIVEIVGSVVGGVILWVRFSPLYGALLLFLGSLSGVIGRIVAWLSNIVLNCFLDSACATKELYDISSKKDITSETQKTKSNDSMQTKREYVIKKVGERKYIGRVYEKEDNTGKKTKMMSCYDAPQYALKFHTQKEAETFATQNDMNPSSFEVIRFK